MPRQLKPCLYRTVLDHADGRKLFMRGQFGSPTVDPADNRMVVLRDRDGQAVGAVRRSTVEAEITQQEAAYRAESPATHRHIARVDVTQWIGHWAP